MNKYDDVYKVSNRLDNINDELVIDILSNLLYLGELFEFSDEEIVDAINKKQNVILERFNDDY